MGPRVLVDGPVPNRPGAKAGGAILPDLGRKIDIRSTKRVKKLDDLNIRRYNRGVSSRL